MRGEVSAIAEGAVRECAQVPSPRQPVLVLNSFNRPMARLFLGTCHHLDADLRITTDGQPLVPRATRPDFEPKVSGSGSQRVPLLTVMKVDSGPMLS